MILEIPFNISQSLSSIFNQKTLASVELRSISPSINSSDINAAAKEKLHLKNSEEQIGGYAFCVIMLSCIAALVSYGCWSCAEPLPVTGTGVPLTLCLLNMLLMVNIVKENKHKKSFRESYQRIEDRYHECRQTFQQEVDLAIQKNPYRYLPVTYDY